MLDHGLLLLYLHLSNMRVMILIIQGWVGPSKIFTSHGRILYSSGSDLVLEKTVTDLNEKPPTEATELKDIP